MVYEGTYRTQLPDLQGDIMQIALVDDDPGDAKTLLDFIGRYAAATGEKIRAECFGDAILFLTNYRPVYDCVFMDIDMPHINGMETAKELRKLDSVVPLIFVSIMVQYAIEGYSVDAMDFLVKPIQYLKFSMKLEKAINYSRKNRQAVFKLVGEDGLTQYVTANEILYAESVNHYVYFHATKGDFKKLISMTKAEQILSEFGFLRCDVSFLINPAYVTMLGNDYLMIGENKIPISRNRKKEFMRRFTSYRKFVY